MLGTGGENRYHAIFGNKNCAIVHPSNLAPALMLFDAVVRTVKADGTRRELEVAKLFVTPEVDIHKENCLEAGEIVESIVIPNKEGARRASTRPSARSKATIGRSWRRRRASRWMARK